MKRTFDWRPFFDERSRNYGVRKLLGSNPIDKIKTFWNEGTVLDQGSEGACVGFGWLGEIIAEPAQPKEQPSKELGNSLAQFYYEEAKKIDEWPGEEYSGTSVLAGAKIMKQHGFIAEYRWCFSIEDIMDTVIKRGPVVVGVPWYSSMYKTNAFGLTSISGEKVGGHCLVITGYDPAMKIEKQSLEVFRWRNSWGKDYGQNGSGYIKASDLRRLFQEGGEACVPVIRNKPVLTYPPRTVRNIWIRNTINFFLRLFNKN